MSDLDHGDADTPEREPVSERDHDTYEQDNWETVHAEGVDQVFAAAMFPHDDEAVRVDFDAFGGGGASTHDYGDNVQVSAHIPRDTAEELVQHLQDAIEEYDERTEQRDGEEV